MGYLYVMLVLFVFDLHGGLVPCCLHVEIGGGESTRCLEHAAEWSGETFVGSAALLLTSMTVMDLWRCRLFVGAK
jgi:hypothetical protein